MHSDGPTSTKTLLCCAHYGEAEALLDNRKWKKLGRGDRPGFEDESGNLLIITGEGIARALNQVALFLGRYESRIHRILNFGLAGSLDDNFPVHSLHRIRTSYYSPAPGHYEFRSFSSQNPDALTDCISSSVRLHDANQSAFYRACAPIVDRELWGIAHAAHNSGIRFDAIKLISDRVGTEDCTFVRDNAKDFSASLAHEVMQHLSGTELRSEPADPLVPIDFTAAWKDSYFTHSSRARFNRLMRILQLQLQTDSSQTIEYARLRFDAALTGDKKTSPKRRALMQIALLEQYTSQELSQESATGLST